MRFGKHIRNTETAGMRLVFGIAVLVLGLFFTGTALAATVQGIKFNDLDGDGFWDDNEPKLANHNVMVRNYDTSDFQTVKTDSNGAYEFNDLPAGTYMVWSGINTGWRQTSPVPGTGLVTYSFEMDANQNKQVNFGITNQGDISLPPEPACQAEPTAVTVQDGDWYVSSTWKDKKIPGPGDRVLIDGHIVTASDKIDLGDGSLCNKGIIQSKLNMLGQSPNHVEIYAGSVQNSGAIIGQDGVDGICPGQHAVPGSSIYLFATLFINAADEAGGQGSIHAGDGGNDLQRCREGIPAYGANGGSVEIFAQTAQSNGGLIETGNGGKGEAWHVHSNGGNGGIFRIITNAFDPHNDSSMSNGTVWLGNGGDAGNAWGGEVGKGGSVDAMIRNLDDEFFLGMVNVPNNGASFAWDPIKLKAGENFKVRHFDYVRIYTDEEGEMDFTQLSEGAINADKTIIIATKSKDGKGGTLDLRGVTQKAFIAGEKIEICADKILLDDGFEIDDIFDAPEVEVRPGKILYGVALSAEQYISGGPGEKIPVKIRIINNGPKEDTYEFSMQNSSGWHSDQIPEKTVKGLSYEEMTLNVTMPGTQGATNVITLTAVSQKDPEVSAEIKIFINSAPGPDSDGDGTPDVWDEFPNDAEKQADSDSDGVDDNADTDDDNDGIADEWEKTYGLNPFSPEDASQDPDEDGYSNLEEHDASTNPNDPESFPASLGDAKIQGFKFNDQNENGIWEDDEAKLANHNILLRNYASKNLLTTKTDSEGEYVFENLEAGIYEIWTGIPPEWHQTTPVSGEELVPYDVTIASGQTLNINWGIANTETPPDEPPQYTAGVFTVIGAEGEEEGVIKADYLFDGGLYEGELGIFSLSGMEAFEPGSPEFIAEAIRRVMSDTEAGHIVIRDKEQGARFDGPLGASHEGNFNKGDYKGSDSFEMKPGDTFATVLIPDGTFAEVAGKPETKEPRKRPLFSLATANPDDGLYYGQVAGIPAEGMDNSFINAVAYEDMSAKNSDRDYNDLIVQIRGIEVRSPAIDAVIDKSKEWRTGTDNVSEHLNIPQPDESTPWITVTLKSPADLLVYDPDGNVIGRDGGTIPGATFEWDENGHQVVTLPALDEGDYNVVLRAIGDGGLCHLEVKGFRGGEMLASEELPVIIEPHQVLKTVLPVAEFTENHTVTFDTPQIPTDENGILLPFDFDGDGDVDDTDIRRISGMWGAETGNANYDAFYDLDNDGRIGLYDIMSVSNSYNAP